MKLFSLIFISLWFIGISFSAELQGELSLISPPELFKEGDVVEGILKVWPIENADLNEFKKLEKMSLANALYVTEVESIEVSANNTDVIETKLLFVVKKFADANQESIKYKDQNLNIKFPPLKIAPSGKDPESYFVLDQGTINSNTKVIISIFILVALIVFFSRKKIYSIIGRYKNDPILESKKAYNSKFLQANTRESFENIYAKRKVWLSLIKEVAPVYKEFFETMEQHQYKKAWNTDDLNEVMSAFETIRRSFSE